MTSIKSKADWEAIERGGCVGVLSVRELGPIYGLNDKSVRNRAKKYGWQRYLANRVHAAAEQQIACRDGIYDSAGPQAQRARSRDPTQIGSQYGIDQSTRAVVADASLRGGADGLEGLALFAPAPCDFAGWGKILADRPALQPQLFGWMMG